jgi:thiamine biosynthesis protein ThiS
MPGGLQELNMEVMVNGKPVDTDEGAALLDVIQLLKLDPDHVVAELNAEIVPREKFDSTLLSPDDRLELVRLVGGG